MRKGISTAYCRLATATNSFSSLVRTSYFVPRTFPVLSTMFKTKNLSPQQLSAFTAIILSVPIAIGIWILRPDWLIALISLVVTFIGSYLLIRFVLESFIYRKIKLIYKFIYQTKATKREETYYKYILPQKGIDEVREDVEQWAEQRRAEIELLKTNEAYRK
ncbi:MAG: phosphate regulon sensor protein PhoR, partial [Sediminibacterium sp.]|nr:phosphate regulon sensor protein PhoR [Sediminibacterium sp.]